jgi:hypothetical protein
MKLTDDQIKDIFTPAEKRRRSIQQSIDNGGTTGGNTDDGPARRVMVESIIEGYQALEPATAVRWIPAGNRKPTDSDFSATQFVIMKAHDSFFVVHINERERIQKGHYWMKITDLMSLPEEPVSPEAVEENEFTQWWATLTVDPFQTHTKDVARAAWKAARNK